MLFLRFQLVGFRRRILFFFFALAVRTISACAGGPAAIAASCEFVVAVRAGAHESFIIAGASREGDISSFLSSERKDGKERRRDQLPLHSPCGLAVSPARSSERDGSPNI